MQSNQVQNATHDPTSILQAARRGDHDAFTVLVSPHAHNLRRLANRFTRNAEDAEDVSQEALLKAFTKLNRFAGTDAIANSEFRSWLATVTINSAIDFVRRKRVKRAVPFEECGQMHGIARSGWGENPELSYARRERMRAVLEAVSDLPADLRKVCLLRNIMELSTKQAALRLGIPTVTVRVRLFRAHRELRKRLAGCRSAQLSEELRPNSRSRNEGSHPGSSPGFALGSDFGRRR
jgi:RNA polymerase sigma-70 factor (ECF subfamily)